MQSELHGKICRNITARVTSIRFYYIYLKEIILLIIFLWCVLSFQVLKFLGLDDNHSPLGLWIDIHLHIQQARIQKFFIREWGWGENVGRREVWGVATSVIPFWIRHHTVLKVMIENLYIYKPIKLLMHTITIKCYSKNVQTFVIL